MFLFTFDAIPSPNNSNNSTGAIILCWVNFKDFHGAEFLAHKTIEEAGWIIKGDEAPPSIPHRTIFSRKWQNECYDVACSDGLSYAVIPYSEED